MDITIANDVFIPHNFDKTTYKIIPLYCDINEYTNIYIIYTILQIYNQINIISELIFCNKEVTYNNKRGINKKDYFTRMTSSRLVVYCLLMCSHLRCHDLSVVP